MAESVGTSASVYSDHYLDLVEGSFMVRSSIRCDDLLLIAAADSKYVECGERCLFERDIAYTGLGGHTLLDVVFLSGFVRPWKTSYSLMKGAHACVSYRDFNILRRKLVRAYNVVVARELHTRTILMLPFSRFPAVPVEYVFAFQPQGISVPLPRVAF